MNITQECVECIINQSLRVAQNIGADDTLKIKMTNHTTKLSKKFDFNSPPPVVAKDVYEDLAHLCNKDDIYKEIKDTSTKKAKELIEPLHVKIKNSDNLLLDATKMAVAGNVIDLAAQKSFDIEKELESIFHIDFAIDDFSLLKDRLENSHTLLYIGDNAGEHIFDREYIKILQRLYPSLDITYLTRDSAIINDITYDEALKDDFTCKLKSSGVATPGFVYDMANEESQNLYTHADIVIAKGMGNYECMSDYEKENIFFLLKVKCNVVAKHIGANLGDIICKKI
jgi:uncharacterized protein with ATP-grasp and redox domains